MEITIKVSTKMENHTEKENIDGELVLFIKEALKMESEKEKEPGRAKSEINIMATSQPIEKTAMDSLNG